MFFSMSIHHVETLVRHKVWIVGFVNFLLGASFALVAFVASSFFQSISGSENVGVFFFVPFFIILLLLLHSHRLFAFANRARFFLLVFIAQIITITGLVFFSDSWWGVFF